MDCFTNGRGCRYDLYRMWSASPARTRRVREASSTGCLSPRHDGHGGYVLSVKSNPDGFLRLLARMSATVFGVSVLSILIFNDAIPHLIAPANPPTLKVIAATDSHDKIQVAVPASVSTSEIVSVPVTVEIDSFKTEKPDTTLLSSVQTLVSSAATSNSQHRGDSQNALPAEDWFKWARFESTPCKVSVQKPEANSDLKAFASRFETGASVFLMNRGSNRLKIQLGTRLSHGVYTVERLTPASGLRETQSVPSETNNGEQVANSFKLGRLVGTDLTSDSFAKNSLSLEPGEMTILKFSDTELMARQSFNEMRSRLRQLSYVAPVAADKLNAIISGCDTNSIGLSANGGPRPAERVKRIHSFLLALFQVHTLHKNFLDKKAVPEAVGNRLMETVDQLNIRLSETSVNLLKLVPEIEMTPEPARIIATEESGSRTDEGLKIASQKDFDSSVSSPSAWTVTLKLTNQGKSVATNLKLGMKVKSQEPRVECSPSEPDYFASLTPGQSVTATYHLTSAQQTASLQSRCIGEISYFSSNVVAHIYISPR